LEAGGLRPPEAVAPAPEEPKPAGDTDVERDLERADAEDTGRGLEFVWLGGEVGYEFVDLQALGGEDLLDGDLVTDSQGGLVYGGALGVRLFVVTLGARFRYAPLSKWTLWTLNAEASLRVPLGNLELFGALSGGYAALGGAEASVATSLDTEALAASGFNLRLLGGLDYYISNTLSLGATLAGETLFLRRNAVKVPDMPTDAEAVYAEEGSGTGAAFTATAVVALHF
jgi:hypothetical protein